MKEVKIVMSMVATKKIKEEMISIHQTRKE